MVYLLITGGFLLAMLLELWMIPKILKVAHAKELFDLPDERKVHNIPIPRLGGYSFLPCIVIAFTFIIGISYFVGIEDTGLHFMSQDYGLFFVAVGAILLFLTGFYDDLIGVGYRNKFIVQIIGAILLFLSGHYINSFGGLLGLPSISPLLSGLLVTPFIVVYIINSINMIDGIDGLASGLCIIALFVFGGVLLYNGDFLYALLAFASVGSLFPFWGFNVFGSAQKKRKLFMGDAGSLLLGYLLSLFAIYIGQQKDEQLFDVHRTQLVMAYSPLLIPLLDVARLFFFRLRKGCSPFYPDKNHIHHKLLRTGLKSRSVMWIILLISLFFILMNTLLSLEKMDLTWILLIDLFLWGGFDFFISRRIRLREQTLVQKNS